MSGDFFIAQVTDHIKLHSFAKINLRLHILGKRSDGYHEIETVLQTVSLHDDLVFSRRNDDSIVLSCDAPDIPTDETNLIVKAATALREHSGTKSGVDIQLMKRIPAKGGLGGASSNAAVSLLGLNEVWNLSLSLDDLKSIGGGLGADVPFFFYGGTAVATGVGKDISTVHDTEKKHLLVVTPTVGVSTAMAYASLNAPSLTTLGSVSILSSSFAGLISSDSNKWALKNDFEGVIFEIEPEIKRAKEALFEAGAQGGLLAGSGSSVFGIFPNHEARERASRNLKCEQGWRVFSCDTISREEYFKGLISSGFPQLRSLNIQLDTGA